MYVPFPFICPALQYLRRARPRARLAVRKLPARMPALTPARGSWVFSFLTFPRQALNRYQLPFSWHRWLKTASAYVHGPQGLAGQDPQ